jgi:hypothetical protein
VVSIWETRLLNAQWLARALACLGSHHVQYAQDMVGVYTSIDSLEMRRTETGETCDRFIVHEIRGIVII